MTEQPNDVIQLELPKEPQPEQTDGFVSVDMKDPVVGVHPEEEWHYIDPDGVQVHANVSCMAMLYMNEKITKECLVWKTGMGEWLHLSEATELMSQIKLEGPTQQRIDVKPDADGSLPDVSMDLEPHQGDSSFTINYATKWCQGQGIHVHDLLLGVDDRSFIIPTSVEQAQSMIKSAKVLNVRHTKMYHAQDMGTAVISEPPPEPHPEKLAKMVKLARLGGAARKVQALKKIAPMSEFQFFGKEGAIIPEGARNLTEPQLTVEQQKAFIHNNDPPPGSKPADVEAAPVKIKTHVDSEIRVPESEWNYFLRAMPLYARNVAMAANGLGVLMGLWAMVFYLEPIFGLFCMLYSMALFFADYCLATGWGFQGEPCTHYIQWFWKAIAYLFAYFLGRYTAATYMASVIYMLAFDFSLFAMMAPEPLGLKDRKTGKWDKRDWRYTHKVPVAVDHHHKAGHEQMTIIDWMRVTSQGNRMYRVIWIIGYLILHIALAINKWYQWDLRIYGARVYLPIAKVFGELLNLNCTAMLIFVTRTLIQVLHEKSSSRGINQVPWYWKWIPVMVLDSNVTFHKAIAKYCIGIFATLHTLAHFANYAFSESYHTAQDTYWDNLPNGEPDAIPQALRTIFSDPEPMGMAFESTKGLTGVLLTMIGVIIFCGAYPAVKRAHFETFWFTHFFLVAWFPLLLIHGPVFWRWSCVPLGLYILDVINRMGFRKNKVVAIHDVGFYGFNPAGIPTVMTLNFDNNTRNYIRNMVYQEGQYIRVQAPHVSEWEWHPFTICSAQDEQVLSIAIRIVENEYSWTNRLMQYLMRYNVHQEEVYKFSHRDPSTGEVLEGRYTGVDGKPMFKVDGPHGAPAQHCFSFNTIMLIGAGIGVTPCCSLLKGIVGWHWKKGFRPHNLHFYWVARITDCENFGWLLQMLPSFKKMQLDHNDFYFDEAEDTKVRELLLQAQEGWASSVTGGDVVNLSFKEGQKHGLHLINYAGGVQVQRAEKNGAGYGKVKNHLIITKVNGQFVHKTRDFEIAIKAGLKAGSTITLDTLPPPNEADEAWKRCEELQNRLVRMEDNERNLEIVLYITGVKTKDECFSHPKLSETSKKLLRALDETVGPHGKPYVILKPGRPNWETEFQSMKDQYVHEEVGVSFCGAPIIAGQLREKCTEFTRAPGEKGMQFILHKENF